MIVHVVGEKLFWKRGCEKIILTHGMFKPLTKYNNTIKISRLSNVFNNGQELIPSGNHPKPLQIQCIKHN